ncbi:MAG: hypothetical protein R3F61_02610 [Myxococcota bacterium]
MSAYMGNVIGEFEIVGSAEREGMMLIDWELSPVRLLHNEFGMERFVLELQGGSVNGVEGVQPDLHTGDHVFVAAEVKADGRMVQDLGTILVRRPDGSTTTPLGYPVFRVDSGEVSIGRNDVHPTALSTVARRGMQWESAVGAAESAIMPMLQRKTNLIDEEIR